MQPIPNAPIARPAFRRTATIRSCAQGAPRHLCPWGGLSVIVRTSFGKAAGTQGNARPRPGRARRPAGDDCNANGLPHPTKASCLSAGVCPIDDFAYNTPTGVWRQVTGQQGFAEANTGQFFPSFSSTAPNDPVGAELAKVFTDQRSSDFYDHPDPIENEVARVGAQELFGWQFLADTQRAVFPVGSFNLNGVVSVKGVWWDHVPVGAGPTPYVPSFISRDSNSAGQLRDHYAMVNAPSLTEHRIQLPQPPLPSNAQGCPQPPCAIVLRPDLPRINPDPGAGIDVFQSYLREPARVVHDGGAFFALQSAGGPAYDVGPELSSGVRALVDSETMWLTPVETEARLQPVHDLTQAIALPRAWTENARVESVVATPAGLMLDSERRTLDATLGDPPAARTGARALFSGTEGSVYFLGGRDTSNRPTYQVWRYDLHSATWSQLFFRGVSPPPVNLLALGYNAADGALVTIDTTADDEETASIRLSLMSPRTGEARVLSQRQMKKADANRKVSLAARSDGSFVLVTSKPGSAAVARRLVLSANGSHVEVTGHKALQGQLLDQIFDTDRGVVVPLVLADGNQLLTTIDSDAFSPDEDADDLELP